MGGYGRAGINNSKVAMTKLANKILPLQPWSVGSSAASSSSTTTTTTSSSTSFQNAIKQERETDQDANAFVPIPVTRPPPSSRASPLKRKRVASSPSSLHYPTIQLVLHEPWLRYVQQATEGLTGPRLKKILGNTLNLCGCEATVVGRIVTVKEKKTRSTRLRKRRKQQQRRQQQQRQQGAVAAAAAAPPPQKSSTAPPPLLERTVDGSGMLQGIVLAETNTTYSLLSKATEKIVTIKKSGTVLRIAVHVQGVRKTFEISR